MLVALTKKGKQAYRVHGLFHKRLIGNALEGLNSEEETVLIRALSKVKFFFEEEYEAMNTEYEANKKEAKTSVEN